VLQIAYPLVTDVSGFSSYLFLKSMIQTSLRCY